VFSLEGNGEDGRPRWRVHVTGRVVPDDKGAEPSITLAEALAECDESLSVGAFYARIDGRALDLGPAFRGVQEVRRRPGAAVARIELPTDVTDEAHYRLHPVLLDACVQAIAAALPPEAVVGHIYLPMGIDRFRLIGRPGRQVWSLVRLTSSPSGDSLSADLRVLDETGQPIAEMLGLRLKRATRSIVRRLSPTISEWLHEVVWRPAPLLTVSAGAEELSGRLAEEIERWTAQAKLARYEDAMRGLDGLSVAYIVAALGALGCELRTGQVVSEESLTEALGILPGYRRLLARWLEILGEEGLLRGSVGGFTVLRAPARVDVDELARELDGHGDVARGELAFLRQCGPRLADVLRGKCDPIELLFPDGSCDSADHLYHDSPIAHVAGALVRETVLATLARLPQERRIRILEVGGGTGGTTAAVLPALPPERCEYVFTDISPGFVARARERFAAYPFLQARPLDIEAEPTSPERFDVIIAANVIHATADVRRTLEHCRHRLAPGGVLVLVEVTVPQRWIDLTFGLTDGWWKVSDHDLRPRYPLLDRDQWIALLERCGFSGVTAVPEPGSVGRALAQQVVIAATRSAEVIHDGATGAVAPWVVLADRSGIGDRLIAGLRARGESCVVVRRTMDGCTPDDGALTANPLRAEEVKRTLRDAMTGPGIRFRVVYLWALDAPDDLGAAVEQGAPLQVVSGALHLIQALSEDTEREARLWLVTRGAHRLATDPAAPAAAQAPLWGLGRTALQEHPELNCICVDLDPSTPDDAVDALLAEILAPGDGEGQVAWRGGQRHAARLVRWHERRRDASWGPAQLEKSKQGSLEGLKLRPIARRAPGPGEVEIAVRASALNFKDVLNALDLYPGDAGPLGSECAGTVVAVGSDVAGVRAGDHVVALAPGSLATTVIARADLVEPKPAQLTFEQAASLPVAFVTAAHALSTVGALRAGERVLIHAAAGGVGLAAVKLAQQRGAEVLATAGSAEKREFLRRQGVAHVFDSRSLEFKAAVMAATDGQGVDVVLNSLSGEAIEASLSVVTPGGRFLEIGKRGILTTEEVARIRPDIRYTIIDWSDVASVTPAAVRRHMNEILAAVETGHLSVLPVTIFPFDAAVAAFRFMAQAGHRGKIVLVHPEAQTEDAALPVRSDGTYFVTGGLGGLGLEVARWLGRKGARSLVLMGRRAPSAEATAAIAELARAGVEVSVVRGDVASRAQVEHAVAAIGGSQPPLRGVVHAAGVLDEGVLMQQDARRFARVMAAKVEGAWNLERATRHLPLDFFVLFSSVAGVFGSPGQANHAAANAFLDAFAHHRRARGLPAISIDWGAWAAVGAAVEEEALRRIARQGIGRMRPDDALSALEAVLADGAVQVVVASVDWTAFLTRMPGGRAPSLLRDAEHRTRAAGQATRASLPVEGRFLAGLNAAAPSKRHALLRDHIAERTRRVLGLEASQPIDPLRPLKEMGIDSLMAVELRNVLKTDLELNGGLPATLVFDYPTVDGIAHYLAREVLGFERAAGPASVSAPSGVLSRVEQLTDEEVDRLLGERLGKGDS
jgi:NADPH:quinone reductase-like Zn-dependent oxidoreductase/SAM-dependent methyltransferase/NADP-dependent 3-hydroxy acid dehydrogenase YdfG